MLVNVTSVGLRGEDLPASSSWTASSRSWWPTWSTAASRTALCRWAERRGARVVDGLEMLLRQGARSLERWTGRPAPLDVMRRALRR